MHRLLQFLLAALLAIVAAQAQPVIYQGGVLNSASYAVPGLPHSDIAQGSLFVVFGERMGPATLRLAQSFPLTTQLAGTSIRVNGGGVSADAVMIYSSASQVAAILPSRIPPGEATLTLIYDNQTSLPVRVRVARSSFGIFTRNQAGGGPGIVQNYVSATDQPVNSLTDAARPGQVMILWGTGLGPVDFDETRPPEVRNLDTDMEVLVAGQSARVLYKGRSPQFPGIDQINFELPAGVPEGCYVPLAIRTGTVMSNYSSLSIASSGRVCSDPHGFSAADLETLRSAGRLRRVSFRLNKLIVLNVIPGVSDQVEMHFERWNHATMLKAAEVLPGTLPFGSCTVFTSRVDPADPFDVTTDPTDSDAGLDGGTALTLSGPRGVKQFTRRSDDNHSDACLGGGIPGITEQCGAEYLAPGAYSVDNGSGGAMVGPLRAALTLPAPFEWTNHDSISQVRRSQELTVTWSGGDPTRDYVAIVGVSTDTGQRIGAEFVCTQRASAGRFTIPSTILSLLPPSGTTLLGIEAVRTGMLQVMSVSMLEPTRFRIPAAEVAFFGYMTTSLKIVDFQ